MTLAVHTDSMAEETWGTRAVRNVLAPNGHSRKLPFAKTLGLSQSVELVSAGWGDVILNWHAESPLDSMDGIIQGGILTVIADYAQGHCFSTTLDAPEGFSTVDFQTRFLRPVPSGQTYTVHSRVLEKSRRTGLVETWFRRADGKPTTHVIGTWQLVERKFEIKK